MLQAEIKIPGITTWDAKQRRRNNLFRNGQSAGKYLSLILTIRYFNGDIEICIQQIGRPSSSII